MSAPTAAPASAKATSGWEKADILLKPIGGLTTALAVAVVGFVTSAHFERQQKHDSNARLYAELMSSREQAEADLRKEMFRTILSTFVGEGSATPESSVLALELLAYNFHESVDVAPLFLHVRSLMAKQGTRADVAELEGRLERLARDVAGKQVAALTDGGLVVTSNLFIGDLSKHPEGVDLPEIAAGFGVEGSGPLALRRFRLRALGVDRAERSVRFLLTSGSSPKAKDDTRNVFSVSPFDFPMIDNTRLPGGTRCAIVILEWTESSVQVALAHFPGDRAALKEKPYYDEVLDALRESEESPTGESR